MNICPFCYRNTIKVYLDTFHCINHKIKTYFYTYNKTIAFINREYCLYSSNKEISLYNATGLKKIINIPYMHVTPETAELVIDKLLKMKAFI